MIQYLKAHGVLMERISDGIAALAVLSWFAPFYQWLSEISAFAALITPPIGLMWLITQLYFKWFRGK